MINSRELYDLDPQVRVRALNFISRAESATGAKILVTCTYRDREAQDALYARGRSTPGSVVTNAKGGESYHNYRLAIDIVPLFNGKPIWNAEDPIWQTLGRIGEEEGFEWGGRWTHFREFPHFQFTYGYTIAQLQGMGNVA